ncbi:MAG: hypothetical protein GF344_12380 [Chitinivibrionales bacterium]|nr:hypothetical protein [Chitinivibrionales bacterium]MBD3357560.1 hypothetical protein [Chitinivibrionales bacterium]
MVKRSFIVSIFVVPAMILVVGGCSDDDDNGVTVEELGAVSLTIDYAGTVSENRPIIIEIKDNKLSDPIRRAKATEDDASVTITDIPTTKDWVIALYQDLDNNGEYDELSEPIVFYSAGEPDHSVGALGDATAINLSPGETYDAGTIAFADDS